MVTATRPHFDFLIVGGGFAGLVTAEQVCNRLGKTCLVVDKRPHIGGNCYDEIDGHGVLIHRYGPHYFRTNSPETTAYLGQFTQWRRGQLHHQVLHGRPLLELSDQRNTFEELLGRSATTEEFEAWLARQRVPMATPNNSEEYVLSQVGMALYEKFFKGYTLKQWKKDPKELDASVCGRIPVRTNRDDRYLTETFQAMPADGYTRLFENLVAACGNRLRLELETDFRNAAGRVNYSFLVYTGPIDDYFDHCFGRLPYRSLRFEPESFTPEDLRARRQADGGGRFLAAVSSGELSEFGAVHPDRRDQARHEAGGAEYDDRPRVSGRRRPRRGTLLPRADAGQRPVVLEVPAVVAA